MEIVTNKRLIKDRMISLIKALSNGVYERESTIRLCLLSALSGESVFLLGPSGIAKSFIAKRLIQAFDQASFFDYLMTRFSTPEEVFGPLSIQDLKENGSYIRLTDGYLPTSDVVFLDEIWKAGPAILNTLLTVINEKTFKNGQDTFPIPMRLLITASNELPEAGSGLEALYDRMLVRIYMHPIQEKKNFKAMLLGEANIADISPELAIKKDEFDLWQSEIKNVALSDKLFEQIYQLKLKIEKSDLYVSDRRWKKSIRLLKACAYFNGRDEVNPLDLFILKDCLWNNISSLNNINSIIERFATSISFDQEQAENLLTQAEIVLSNAKVQIHKCLNIKVTAKQNRRSEWFSLVLEDAKRYSLNNNDNMIKLVLLQANPSVSATQEGDTEWVYVDADELVKKIKKGKCEIYGYINRHPKISALQFEINANQELVINDITQRHISLALVKDNNDQLADREKWKNNAELAQNNLLKASQLLNQSRIQFHSALPHSFLDEALLVKIENSLQQIIEKMTQIEELINLTSQRVLNIAKYFE